MPKPIMPTTIPRMPPGQELIRPNVHINTSSSPSSSINHPATIERKLSCADPLGTGASDAGNGRPQREQNFAALLRTGAEQWGHSYISTRYPRDRPAPPSPYF